MNTNMPTKNPAAVALGRLAKGKPKHFSPEEIAKRTARLLAGRRKQMTNANPKQNHMSTEFLKGFAAATNLSAIQADEQWAAWSRQLSDTERAQIEAGGYDAGMAEGKRFAEQAKSWWQDQTENGDEHHTPRVWEQIAQAAEQAGDLERAKEAREAMEQAERNP